MKPIFGFQRKINRLSLLLQRHLPCNVATLQTGCSVRLVYFERYSKQYNCPNVSLTFQPLKTALRILTLTDSESFLPPKRSQKTCHKRRDGMVRSTRVNPWMPNSLKYCGPYPILLIFKRIKTKTKIPELMMPNPNPFIPKNFTVHKREVDSVIILGCNALIDSLWNIPLFSEIHQYKEYGSRKTIRFGYLNSTPTSFSARMSHQIQFSWHLQA